MTDHWAERVRRRARPPALTRQQFELVLVARRQSESVAQLADRLGVSAATVSRASRGLPPYDRPELLSDEHASAEPPPPRPARRRPSQPEVAAARRGRSLRRDARENRARLLAALHVELVERGRYSDVKSLMRRSGKTGVALFYRNWTSLDEALGEVRAQVRRQALDAVRAASTLRGAWEDVTGLQRGWQRGAYLVWPSTDDPEALATAEDALARLSEGVAPRDVSLCLWAHAAALGGGLPDTDRLAALLWQAVQRAPSAAGA